MGWEKKYDNYFTLLDDVVLPLIREIHTYHIYIYEL